MANSPMSYRPTKRSQDWVRASRKRDSPASSVFVFVSAICDVADPKYLDDLGNQRYEVACGNRSMEPWRSTNRKGVVGEAIEGLLGLGLSGGALVALPVLTAIVLAVLSTDLVVSLAAMVGGMIAGWLAVSVFMVVGMGLFSGSADHVAPGPPGPPGPGERREPRWGAPLAVAWDKRSGRSIGPIPG